MELLDHINKRDFQQFENASAKGKAQLIIRNFQNEKRAQLKVAKAKTEEEKETYSLHAERFWILAKKQVMSLSEEELFVYLSAIKGKLARVIAERNDNKVVDNKLLFGTLIRELPENLSERNNEIKSQLVEMLASLDFSFEM